MIIYLITNNINGKMYVGQTIRPLNVRWLGHCGTAERGKSNGHLHLAICKYNKSNFTLEILEKVKSQKDLDKAEKKWIEILQTQDPKIGYNLTVGGNPHAVFKSKTKKIRPPISEETRLKMRLAKLGKKMTPRTPEACLNISKARKGCFVSEETRAIQSRAHKGKFTQKMRIALEKRLKEKRNGRQNFKNYNENGAEIWND